MKKSLPVIDPEIESICQLPYVAVKWETLKTAFKLDVFSHLSEPVEAGEVAARLSTHPENTEHLLNALTASGYLNKKNGRYWNKPLAEAYFTRGKDTSIAQALLYMDAWNQGVMNGEMERLVKEGPKPLPDMTDEDLWEKAARININMTRAGRAQAIAGLVSSWPEFSSFSKILDLGAGAGVIGLAVTAAHPTLKCRLLDKPAVTKVAREVIAEYGLEDRIEVIGGDYVRDPLGEGYDLIMANYTLNFYRDNLDGIMTRVHEALKPNGLFLVTSDGLTEEKTAPELMVVGWLPVQLQGEDMTFQWDDVPRAMFRAGFAQVHSTVLDVKGLQVHGPIVAHLARKKI